MHILNFINAIELPEIDNEIFTTFDHSKFFLKYAALAWRLALPARLLAGTAQSRVAR
jgi:hypothetical protein